VDPVLDIRGLRKTFTLHAAGNRKVEALRGVSLRVAAGEHVALAGPSGAGKSSVLKCVYRTYLPSAGAIHLRRAGGTSVDLARLPDHEIAGLRHTEIAYVSQFLRAEPRRTALTVVARAGMRGGMAADLAAQAAAEALGRLRLDRSLWDTHPILLSGGEQQRVNLAAATIAPARLLLLDEPVAALDAANRRAVLDLVTSLPTRGAAVLSVFHDPDILHRVATRVILLHAGQITADGAPADLLATADLR